MPVRECCPENLQVDKDLVLELRRLLVFVASDLIILLVDQRSEKKLNDVLAPFVKLNGLFIQRHIKLLERISNPLALDAALVDSLERRNDRKILFCGRFYEPLHQFLRFAVTLDIVSKSSTQRRVDMVRKRNLPPGGSLS
jgi:hypothetical protein